MNKTPAESTEPKSAAAASVATARTERLVSLDAYRGFVMLAMASGGLGLAKLVTVQGSAWQIVAEQFQHVQWVGMAFWDLIQPSFMFIVGVAMPFSYARRNERGESPGKQARHALVRSIVLVLLAVFLASNSQPETDWVFTNVLAQIGLGYTFAYMLLGRRAWVQFLALVLVLGGYWVLFYRHPLPGPDFDFAQLGMTAEQMLPGKFAPWSRNVNFAAQFDRWFLNLFPRSEPFVFNSGGYQTLNFVPSIATTILGILAGRLLQSPKSPGRKLVLLLLAGVVCLAAGLATGLTVCPIVKRIWTPSWVLFSAAWTFWLLAAFYAVIDVWGYRAWSLPLVVIGVNPITMYMLSQTLKPWIARQLQIHFGQGIFGGAYGPVVQSATVLFVLWLFCYWLYRQRVFLRI